MEKLKALVSHRHFRTLFFILGLGLFGLLIFKFDPRALAENLAKMGYKFIFILLVALVWYLAYALAWQIFLKSLNREIHLSHVFKIKVVGEAINSMTPLSWGGGDPARIWMIKEHIPVQEGTASVVVDRTLNNLAIAVFMALGLVISFIKFSLPPYLELALILAILSIMGAAVFLWYRSHEGLFAFFLDVLKKCRLKKDFSDKTIKNIKEIDGHISQFYKNNKKGFILAFGLHFVGRLAGVAEIYLAANFLLYPIGLLDSYLLASMAVLVNLVFVFVPGSLGVMEGAFAGVFSLLNLDPLMGASIQVTRRLRVVCFGILGLFFMAQLRRGKGRLQKNALDSP
jgi:uncharacterized protein (TIRG00374 family)